LSPPGTGNATAAGLPGASDCHRQRTGTVDPAAADRIRSNITLDGRTPVPVILLSNIIDATVPLHISNHQLATAREQGLGDRVVGRWSTCPGHCLRPPGEIVAALDDRLRWVDSGERSSSGEQRRVPAAAARAVNASA